MLRPPRPADYADWASLRAVSRAHLVPFEPRWADDELSRPAFRDRLRRYQLDARNGTSFAFFVMSGDGGKLLGGITLANIRRGAAQAASVGYWIGAPVTRQGFASAALGEAVRFAFEDLRLNRVEAACLPHNDASLRTLARNGFAREGLARRYLRIDGTWQDHVLLGLCRDDWPAELRRRSQP